MTVLLSCRTADLIVAIKDGVVQEEGTHNELMKLEGLYHSLVMRSVSTPVFTICISNSQPGFLYVF